VQQGVVQTGIGAHKTAERGNAGARCYQVKMRAADLCRVDGEKSQRAIHLQLRARFELFQLFGDIAFDHLFYQHFKKIVLFAAVNRVFPRIVLVLYAEDHMLPGGEIYAIPVETKHVCRIGQRPDTLYFYGGGLLGLGCFAHESFLFIKITCQITDDWEGCSKENTEK
jgi:hypothetical protein